MDPTAFVYMALSGESEYQQRSCGAVVVDAASCHAKFTLLADIEPAAVRTQLAEQLRIHPNNLYILNKTAEHMHVFAYPRDRALQQARDGMLPTLAPPETASD